MLALSVADLVGYRASCRVSFVLSDILNPGYIIMDIGVDAHITSHELSNLNPLELVLADDSSDSHFLQRLCRERERGR